MSEVAGSTTAILKFLHASSSFQLDRVILIKQSSMTIFKRTCNRCIDMKILFTELSGVYQSIFTLIKDQTTFECQRKFIY